MLSNNSEWDYNRPPLLAAMPRYRISVVYVVMQGTVQEHGYANTDTTARNASAFCSGSYDTCLVLAYIEIQKFHPLSFHHSTHLRKSTMKPLHSYYPVGVEIPSYIPNEWSTLALVSTFAVTCTIVLAAAKTIATNVNPRITIPELSKVLWFTLCTFYLPLFMQNQ